MNFENNQFSGPIPESILLSINNVEYDYTQAPPPMRGIQRNISRSTTAQCKEGTCFANSSTRVILIFIRRVITDRRPFITRVITDRDPTHILATPVIDAEYALDYTDDTLDICNDLYKTSDYLFINNILAKIRENECSKVTRNNFLHLFSFKTPIFTK